MERIPVSTNFFLDEFIPPDIYSRFKGNSIWYIDPRLIDIAQLFRERFQLPVAINNWMVDGKDFTNYLYKESGYRTPATTIGSIYSQHKRGLAIDMKLKHGQASKEDAKVFYDEIREDILKYFHTVYKPLGLTTIEKDTPTWLHIDLRWTNLTHLFIVNYK